MDRVMIFVDGSNLYTSLKNIGEEWGEKLRLDYVKLFKFITRGRRLIRVYYYLPVPPKEYDPAGYESQMNFADTIKKICRKHNINIDLKITMLKWKTIHCPDGPMRKLIEKGVDVRIASDMLSLAFHNAYDVAILLSGDSDFVEVVEEIKHQGKIVENAVFREASSKELRDACDNYIYLDDYLDRFRMIVDEAGRSIEYNPEATKPENTE